MSKHVIYKLVEILQEKKYLAQYLFFLSYGDVMALVMLWHLSSNPEPFCLACQLKPFQPYLRQAC